MTSKYRSRYVELLGDLSSPNSDGEVSIHCPFHEDHKRSASVNIGSGLFFCMACEASHNFATFKKSFVKIMSVAKSEDDSNSKVIPEQVVRDLHYDLITNQEMIDRLELERGISLITIKSWKIGWSSRLQRLAIPIRDEDNLIRNIRLYSFDQSGSQKMISWRAGYGTARLWPMDAFDKSYVILCEGEMDRLLLWQQGLNTVTSTGGAKTWKSEWSSHFKDMQVRIVYDMDEAGDEGARKAAASISEFAAQIKIIKLDLTKKGEDVTDFFVNYGYSLDDLRNLAQLSPVYRPPLREEDFQQRDGSPWVTLGQSLASEHRGSSVMIPVIVASRRDERLHYPKETYFSCNQDAGRICKACKLNGVGESTIKIKPSDSRITRLVGVSQRDEQSLLRAWAGIPQSCGVVDQSIMESGTIEEILITPEIDTARSDDDLHLVQRGFYVGYGLDYNASYVLKSKPVPFHKNLKIVHQVVDAVPAHDSIESFEMTAETEEKLRVFQASDGQVKRKLWEIATDLQNHVTKIWDRLLLHIAMDLVWHSVMDFEFDGKLIRRGWLEAIVIGDTRTGKSEVASQLQRHYGYGEMVSGENTSYAGLIGGAVHFDDAWFVKWGRLPLNDRRMVIIDEITGMTVDEIGRMSGVRESGIADITKIETQKANARTRALWISNVRPPQQDLSDYEHGCLALNDIIGMPEDIARFDYSLSAAHNEVSPEVVNRSHNVELEQAYGRDLCRDLIRWIWSRATDQVAFERGAIESCYLHAVEMGEAYTSAMPLVMAENQRIKLARVAAAIAGRLFSTDDGETLVITEEHVDAARNLLDTFYGQESFGYQQFSARSTYDAKRREEGKDTVRKHLASRPEVIDVLTQFRNITPRKLASYAGITEMEAEESVRLFTKYRLVEDKGSHGSRVTAALKIIAESVNPVGYKYGE